MFKRISLSIITTLEMDFELVWISSLKIDIILKMNNRWCPIQFLFILQNAFYYLLVFRQAKSLHFPRNIKWFSGPIFYSIDVFMLLFDGDSDNGRYGLFDNASTISILMQMFLFHGRIKGTILSCLFVTRRRGGDNREIFMFCHINIFFYVALIC